MTPLEQGLESAGYKKLDPRVCPDFTVGYQKRLVATLCVNLFVSHDLAFSAEVHIYTVDNRWMFVRVELGDDVLALIPGIEAMALDLSERYGNPEQRQAR